MGLEEAYRAYYPIIRSIAARKYCPDLSEDLAQETFVVAFKNWHKLKTPYVLQWLKTILSRVWYRHLERNNRSKRRVDLIPLDDISVASFSLDENARMDGAELIGCVRSLPSGDGHCIEMRAMGFEIAEIARSMGVSSERIRQRIARGMGRLDKKWEMSYGVRG